MRHLPHIRILGLIAAAFPIRNAGAMLVSRATSLTPPAPAAKTCWNQPTLNDGALYVVHIPKTAVCSVLMDLKAIPGHPPLYSHERCVQHARDMLGVQSTLVMLREPRAHVLSQYWECKTGLDWPVNSTGYQLPGFQAWVHAWANKVRNGSSALSVSYEFDEFGCYRPVDFQCQRMTCSYQFDYPERVNTTAAVQRLQQLGFVGIVEHYQASVCLFHFKISGHLPQYCNCKDVAAWRSFNATRIEHGVQAHRTSNLSAAVLEEVDLITQGDRLLYGAAIERLRQELQAVESRTGVQVLCG